MKDQVILSELDRRILAALQADSRLSNQELADQIGSSPSSVWRRVRVMEQAGIIDGFRLSVSAEMLGWSETVLVHVSLNTHSDESTRAFTELVENAPEVLECYAVTGEHDYLLKVLATDMRSYYRFLEGALMSKGFISRTSSTVVMSKIKETGQVPVR